MDESEIKPCSVIVLCVCLMLLGYVFVVPAEERRHQEAAAKANTTHHATNACIEIGYIRKYRDTLTVSQIEDSIHAIYSHVRQGGIYSVDRLGISETEMNEILAKAKVRESEEAEKRWAEILKEREARAKARESQK